MHCSGFNRGSKLSEDDYKNGNKQRINEACNANFANSPPSSEAVSPTASIYHSNNPSVASASRIYESVLNIIQIFALLTHHVICSMIFNGARLYAKRSKNAVIRFTLTFECALEWLYR